jgi:hypothetical protein
MQNLDELRLSIDYECGLVESELLESLRNIHVPKERFIVELPNQDAHFMKGPFYQALDIEQAPCLVERRQRLVGPPMTYN